MTSALLPQPATEGNQTPSKLFQDAAFTAISGEPCSPMTPTVLGPTTQRSGGISSPQAAVRHMPPTTSRTPSHPVDMRIGKSCMVVDTP